MALRGAELTCNTQCGPIIITERLLLWQAYHSWNSSDNEVVTKTAFLFPLWTRARIMNHSLFFQIIKNHYIKCVNQVLNTLRPRQNGRHFADDTFKYMFLNENVIILIKILLKFVPKGPINNIPALVQIMAWCWPGTMPLSEPMMVRLLYIYIYIYIMTVMSHKHHQGVSIQWPFNSLFKCLRLTTKKWQINTLLVLYEGNPPVTGDSPHKGPVFLKFHWSLFLRVQLIISQHWFR